MQIFHFLQPIDETPIDIAAKEKRQQTVRFCGIDVESSFSSSKPSERYEWGCSAWKPSIVTNTEDNQWCYYLILCKYLPNWSIATVILCSSPKTSTIESPKRPSLISSYSSRRAIPPSGGGADDKRHCTFVGNGYGPAPTASPGAAAAAAATSGAHHRIDVASAKCIIESLMKSVQESVHRVPNQSPKRQLHQTQPSPLKLALLTESQQLAGRWFGNNHWWLIQTYRYMQTVGSRRHRCINCRCTTWRAAYSLCASCRISFVGSRTVGRRLRKSI